jgi:hypothetical protein
VPGTHSRIAGITVLASRPGSARGLHVHGRVIPSQSWSNYPRSLLIKNRDSCVRSLPQSRFALRGLSGNMLDAVDACYSAQRRNGSAGERKGDGPGTGTRHPRRLIVAHAPGADRAGNAASKRLSVPAASAGTDLHDAHNSEEYNTAPEPGRCQGTIEAIRGGPVTEDRRHGSGRLSGCRPACGFVPVRGRRRPGRRGGAPESE